MRRRIYVDGQPAWSENEPDCRARPVGFGGTSAGFWSGTQLTVKQRRDLAPAKRLPRQANPRRETA